MEVSLKNHLHPTFGLLSGWPVYGSYAPDRFVEYISQGIQAFARENDCNLMLGLGLSRIMNARSLHTAWPVLSPDTDFIPVGPWNTDGLIVLAPLRNEERSQYLQQLREAGFPIVFIGAGERAPFVSVDNQSGIHQAVDHLIEHGHQKIAFIAGDPKDPGDSLARLQGYQSALQLYRLELDSRLIGYGHHYQEGGYQAMKQILEKGVDFTAVVASNDVSAIGAMMALQQAGLRIPEDVAVIGFDDQPLASGQDPPLTTIHYPLYDAGYQAGKLLYDHLINHLDISERELLIPARLVYRQSCGCIAGDQRSWQIPNFDASRHPEKTSPLDHTIEQMRQALASQMLTMPEDDIYLYCKQMAEALQDCIQSKEGDAFYRTVTRILRGAEELKDDVHSWQGAITVLWNDVTARPKDAAERNLAEIMLHRARVMISEVAQRQKKQNMIQQSLTTHQLGWLSGYLFSAQSESQIIEALSNLPKLGVKYAHVGFFEGKGEDAVANVRYCIPYENKADPTGVDSKEIIWRFPSREFPPTRIFPEEIPFFVAVLPLVFLDDAIGFIVFDGNNLEPLAVIVRQLTAAIKSARLHATILEMSITDSLTGLFNRRYFEDFLGKELERSRRYHRSTGMIMIDLDHFKDYNDQFGHQAGDTALRKIAKNIKDTVRHKMDVVARYGGEEFIIALPETDVSGAEKMAERIRARIEAMEGLEARLTISVGVSACHDGNLSLEALVSRADKALYCAKNKGRNQVCQYDSSS